MNNETRQLLEQSLIVLEEAKTNYDGPEKWERLHNCENAITAALAKPVQQPVATVIEELGPDGQGWCSKVRWLFNPVPVGETLSWEQPK